eukprot:763576-Hanusia_phi.AAC.11
MMSQQLISLNRLLGETFPLLPLCSSCPLTRVPAEVSSKHERSGCSLSTIGSDSWVSSSRDSRLTQTLAPLLAGNNQTILLCTISPDAEDQLDTLNSLRCCHRALCISNACHRILNIDVGDFSCLPSSEVLGDTPGGSREHGGGKAGSRKQPAGGSMHKKLAELEDEVYHARLDLDSSERRTTMPQEVKGREEKRREEERRSEEARRRVGEQKARVRFDRRQDSQQTKGGGTEDRAWEEAYREISSIDEGIQRGRADHGAENARVSDGWRRQGASRSPADFHQGQRTRQDWEAKMSRGGMYARDEDEAYEIEEEDFVEESDGQGKAPDDLRNEFHHVLDRMNRMEFREEDQNGYSPIGMEVEEEDEEGWVFRHREEEEEEERRGRTPHVERDRMQRDEIDYQYAEIVQRIAKQAKFSSLEDEQEGREREEMITRQEIKLVELRQELVELKRRLRLSMSEGGQEEVFSEYEAEISRLNQALSLVVSLSSSSSSPHSPPPPGSPSSQARQHQMASDLAAQEASSSHAGDRARELRDFTRKNLTRSGRDFSCWGPDRTGRLQKEYERGEEDVPIAKEVPAGYGAQGFAAAAGVLAKPFALRLSFLPSPSPSPPSPASPSPPLPPPPLLLADHPSLLPLQALNAKEDELQREKERVEEAQKKAIDLQYALGEATRKEQLLKVSPASLLLLLLTPPRRTR